MFKPLLDAVSREFSGERAKGHVEELVRYHRIQASSGLRAAAGYAYDYLRSLGLKAEILRFAADGKTRYWGAVFPQEWECSAAELRLVQSDGSTELLADYGAEKMSVIQRSAPTPPEGLEAEVVVLEDGLEGHEYEGLDVAGKLVLSRGRVARVHDLAVQRRGALGIIFDGMNEQPPVRQALDLAEARQYTSFWWQPEDKPCFGFVLSPRQGLQLRRKVKAARERGESVRLRARVSSRLFDGQADAASAAIVGETDEEILVVAHLCHPQPSANDNGSGVAAVLEVARTLRTLIAQGALPRPRRGIRFLVGPEIYGTCAYLASDERRVGRSVAAINLDMVGENQDICGSTLVVEGLPHAAAAPVDTLALAIQEALAHERHDLLDLGTFTLIRYDSTPYNGGSDHIVLSDPSVGIPCPMLNQWPDRFYHTGFDTVDKVDPRSLRFAGVLTATYAAFLAGAGAEEAVWLAHEAQARYKGRMARRVQDGVTGIQTSPALRAGKKDADSAAIVARERDRLHKHLLYLGERHQAALAWLPRLGGPGTDRILKTLESEAATVAWHAATAAAEMITALAARAGLPALPGPAERELDTWDQAAQAIVPLRRTRGPVFPDRFTARLEPARRDALRALSETHKETPEAVLELALMWADGKRNLLEIADLVELETGVRDVEYLVQYVRWLQEMALA